MMGTKDSFDRSGITLHYTVVPMYWVCLPSLPSDYQILLLAAEVQDGEGPRNSRPLPDPHSAQVLQPPELNTLSGLTQPLALSQNPSLTLSQPGQPYSSIVSLPKLLFYLQLRSSTELGS